jgi:hypothetical protein
VEFEGFGSGPLNALLEAVGRLIAERFQQTSQEQTGDLLTGGGNLLTAFLERLGGMLAGGLIEWLVRAAFLTLGVFARSLLLAFGPQVAFLQGIMVGAPWELTAGLPEVQSTARLAQGAAFLCLPAAIAWSGLGYQFSFTDGGAEGFAKRLIGGGVLIGSFPWLLGLTLQFTDALGKYLLGSGDPVPGYASMSEAVMEGIAVAASVTPPVSGAPAATLSTAMLSLASDATIAAGAVAFVYTLAIIAGGSSAAARIVVLDALYVLSPLVALAYVTPIGGPIFAIFVRSWGTVLLVVIPAGLILKLASALMVAFSAGGPLWVALIGVTAVTAYSVIVGRAAFGLAFSAPGTARRIVHVVAGR